MSAPCTPGACLREIGRLQSRIVGMLEALEARYPGSPEYAEVIASLDQANSALEFAHMHFRDMEGGQ